MKYEIIVYDGKFWINLFDLREMGFPLPIKGTKLIWRHAFGDFDTHYKFFENRDGWSDGLFISPFSTNVGEKFAGYGELYVEFNQDNFIKNY